MTQKVTPHVYYYGAPPDPLKDTRGFAWTAENSDMDRIINGDAPSASHLMNIPPSEFAAQITRVNDQFDNQAQRIEDTMHEQPRVKWVKRTIWVLAAALIPLAVAKLLLPLIIVGAVLVITAAIYLHMHGNISTEARALAENQRDNCHKLARNDITASKRQLRSYRFNPVPRPEKKKKEPTSWKDYSDAYNEFVVQQMLGGHSGHTF